MIRYIEWAYCWRLLEDMDGRAFALHLCRIFGLLWLPLWLVVFLVAWLLL